MEADKRDFLSVDDLTIQEIEAIFHFAGEVEKSPSGFSNRAVGRIMATLFYEPSTRTRLSFESAMQKLGGGVISSPDMKASSAVKGESLADTARVIGSYSDLIVLRHPYEGAARLASRYTGLPVINAGDGAHEHPSQTLCDLYTLRREKGRLAGISVALCGDLKHGRTVHSLAIALARFGANVLLVSPGHLEMPDHLVQRLEHEFRCTAQKASLGEARGLLSDMDAVYITPQRPHQLSLFTDPAMEHGLDAKISRIDALYMTRLQRERMEPEEVGTRYPVIDRDSMKDSMLRDAIVMHPLPRSGEISPEVDRDPRSRYFEQAALGVPVRMALLAFLLGAPPFERRSPSAAQTRPALPLYRSGVGIRCPNANCISHHEPHVPSEFRILDQRTLQLRCEFCAHETLGRFVAPARGKSVVAAGSDAARRIKPENLVIFRDEGEVAQAGLALRGADE